MAYELTRADLACIDELENLWWGLEDSFINNKPFNIKIFQIIAKETYDFLVKFRGVDALPRAVVSLLLSIRYVSASMETNSDSNIEAAYYVADAFCNVMNEKVIGGFANYPLFQVRGTSKLITIDTDTFDLKELADDFSQIF